MVVEKRKHILERRKSKRSIWVKAWSIFASIVSAAILVKGGYDVINYLHKIRVEKNKEELSRRIVCARSSIRDLFDAMRTSDIDKYMDHWDDDSKQVSDSYSRTKAQIRAKRIDDFKKYEHIWTKELLIEIPEPDPNRLDVYINHTMRFVPRDKTQPAFSEIDVRERYILVWKEDTKRWRIKLNITYLRGFPSDTPVMEKQ